MNKIENTYVKTEKKKNHQNPYVVYGFPGLLFYQNLFIKTTISLPVGL